MPTDIKRPWPKRLYETMGGPGPWRRLTASQRRMPDFLIIGAMRAGTTSLYSYICQHPQVAPSLRKEIHFFDRNFHKGHNWYRAHFPCCRSSNILTGEATPYYLFHPVAPLRINDTLPGIKLIAILRNPVDRAYSHYWQKIRRGRETLSFADALAAEDARLQGESERLRDEPGSYSFNHNHFAYRARGRYAEQLEHWFELVPRDRILVVSGEELYRHSQNVMNDVFAFLGLPTTTLPAFPASNQADYPAMDADVRRQLAAEFAPHNQRLYRLLGKDFGWTT
jgi:hypothetical protein